MTITPPRLALPFAGCQIALNAGLVPQTLPSVQANPGDTQLSVADVRRFVHNGIASFWDGTAEAPLAIDHVDPPGQIDAPAPVPGTIYLDFSGQPYSGLQYTHTTTATIATNLLDTIPADTGDMLQNGWPVVSFFVLDGVAKIKAFPNAWIDRVVLSCCYQLAATQRDDQPKLHSQLHVRQNVQRSERDIWTLKTALKSNQTFTVGGVANANWIENFVQSLRNNVDPKLTEPLWEQYFDIAVDVQEPN